MQVVALAFIQPPESINLSPALSGEIWQTKQISGCTEKAHLSSPAVLPLKLLVNLPEQAFPLILTDASLFKKIISFAGELRVAYS